MNHEITNEHLLEEGYGKFPLSWDGECARWGDAIIPMILGELDEAPEGISEVRLLVPFYWVDGWMDGALITGSPPVQKFSGPRQYVEQPVSGHGVGIGITPDGSSIMYIPEATYNIHSRKIEGSISYSEGWTWTWVNMGKHDFQYIELCLPKYEKDDTSYVLSVGSPVEAPMFWGLWNMLQTNIKDSI